MNDEPIEAHLRHGPRARPSAELDHRMEALFATAPRPRLWAALAYRPVPVWGLAAACLLSAVAGFAVRSLRPPPAPTRAAPATVTVCLLDPDHPLARHFLGPPPVEPAPRLSEYTVSAGATGTPAPSPAPAPREERP